MHITQVTFQPESAAAEAEERSSLRRLSLWGLDVALYTHSFLGYGQDAAQLQAHRQAALLAESAEAQARAAPAALSQAEAEA